MSTKSEYLEFLDCIDFSRFTNADLSRLIGVIKISKSYNEFILDEIKKQINPIKPILKRIKQRKDVKSGGTYSNFVNSLDIKRNAWNY